jgi:RNA polymerase sigma factor (sigma-70 family)
VAYLILRDRCEAEDVVAETLITAHERGRSLRDPAALRAWLFRVATNHALGIRRKRSRVVQLHVLPDVVTHDATEIAADRIVLSAAIAQLSPRVRAAIVLRYYADLPVEAVAEALGTSPNTVKSQLRVGLDRLRAAIGEPKSGDEEVRHA